MVAKAANEMVIVTAAVSCCKALLEKEDSYFALSAGFTTSFCSYLGFEDFSSCSIKIEEADTFTSFIADMVPDDVAIVVFVFKAIVIVVSLVYLSS